MHLVGFSLRLPLSVHLALLHLYKWLMEFNYWASTLASSFSKHTISIIIFLSCIIGIHHLHQASSLKKKLIVLLDEIYDEEEGHTLLGGLLFFFLLIFSLLLLLLLYLSKCITLQNRSLPVLLLSPPTPESHWLVSAGKGALGEGALG